MCVYVCVYICAGGTISRASEGGEYEFAAGDSVRVDVDLQTVKLMQEGHGGWADAMTDVICTAAYMHMQAMGEGRDYMYIIYNMYNIYNIIYM